MAATKFIVSIRNAKTGQWRDSYETSLAACVTLTLGIGTLFTIVRCSDHAEIDNVKSIATHEPGHLQGSGNAIDKDLLQRYQHAKRSLITGWMRRFHAEQIRTIDEHNDYRFEIDRSDLHAAHSMRVWLGTDSTSIQL